MGVYLYPNNTETPLKKAYIWEYEEPIFNYSYTFKWKTAAEIWNTWTLLTWTLQTNSNWVCGSSSTDCRIKVDIPSLADAEKIVISGTVVINNSASSPNNNAAGLVLSRGSWWGNGESGYQVYGSGYGGMRVLMSDWNTGVNWNVVGNATLGNTYSPTTTIDLVNKTITWVMSWFDNSILTLTDSQISTLRTFTYLVAYISVNKSAVQDISITIY